MLQPLLVKAGRAPGAATRALLRTAPPAAPALPSRALTGTPVACCPPFCTHQMLRRYWAAYPEGRKAAPKETAERILVFQRGAEVVS